VTCGKENLKGRDWLILLVGRESFKIWFFVLICCDFIRVLLLYPFFDFNNEEEFRKTRGSKWKEL